MPKREHMARWYREDGTIDQHTSCHHRMYGLTCDDFAALLDHAGYACEVCGREDVKLQIDHAHAADDWGPVRGLLCPKCNTAMKYVDSGFREPCTEALARYAAKAKAAERGETVTDVLVRALERYVKR